MTPPGPPGLRVILCQTRHAGNIGSVARIMGNLGQSGLTLVNPTFRGHLEAIRMASGGAQIIENSQEAGSLEEALEGSALSFAVTRRPRKITKTIFTPEEAAAIIAKSGGGETALVFGSEKLGLSTGQVRLCGAVIAIPTAPDAPSMNLAQAVAVILYLVTREWRPAPSPSAGEPSTTKERMALFGRMEEVLEKSGYFKTRGGAQTMADIEDIFNRASMTHRDVKLLFGMFRRIGAAVEK
jgi:TrmH family RNA methyltransferase